MQTKKSDSFLDDRRNRLHQLVVAFINQQGDLDLLDAETPEIEQSSTLQKPQDPARWLDRNRRILKRYQSLVRSAVTIDALIDAEQPSEG